MFVGNIKDDFDKLRGSTTLDEVGKRTGVHRQAVYMSFQREHVVYPQIVRMFEAIGYDIALTFIKRDDFQDPDTVGGNASRRSTFQIRRGDIRMNSRIPDTKYMTVSSSAMMSAIEEEGHDISDLPVIGEYRNLIEANAAYQDIKKDLSSYEKGGHDFADVMVLVRIDQDGTFTMVNKWVGKLARKPTRGRGRPPKNVSAVTINDALHVLAAREK